MWNKLFRKKQSKVSNKSAADESKQAPASSFKCFSFRGGRRPSAGDSYRPNDSFQYLQYESEIYKRPDFDGGHEYSRLYQPEQHQQPDEHQQLNEIFIEIPPPNIRLDLCPVCSRKFSPESLMKHVIICEKINTKKRKPFDSSKQRLHGTEFTGVVSTSPTLGLKLQPQKYENRVSPPKILQRKASVSSLKSQSSTYTDRNYLTSNMSRKSSVNSLVATPRAKRSVAQQSEKCPHCERVFGYKAYDRHVEWCKEKALIKPSPDMASVSAAKERLKTRITYKAPSLKTKRGVTRDKYSNSCNGSNNSLADFDSHLNSMSSSMTSENGFYDPFLSAKKQLEELFSPTTTPTTQMINSMMVTPSATPKTNNNGNDIMSKSLTLTSHAVSSPKTPQPIPKMQSNFKRTSSLRISNRKPKPAIYTPSGIKSNIHCGITDDGPISPSFVKAKDYDELPIKSPYSAIKLVEKNLEMNQIQSRMSPANQMQPRSSPSPTMPSIVQPIMRDKSQLIRKNLKLDLKNPNAPANDYSLSKTDSLAMFLKYENDLNTKLSEKELKDKSNSLSKRSQNALNGIAMKEHKLPDINGKPLQHQMSQPKMTNGGDEKSLISIDDLGKSRLEDNQSKSHSAPVKPAVACDNLPALTQSSGSDKSRSPSVDRKTDEETSPSQGRRSGGSSALRRQMKYNMDNILFDTDPEVKSTASSSDNSNNNSLKRPESRISNTESIFEDFDFDQFIASFTDDDQFPIFKDYKAKMNKSPAKADEENNNVAAPPARPPPPFEGVVKNLTDTKPIPIQRSEAEITGLEKLDNLCKLLSGNSDSDESNSLETDPGESQTVRSKSSADSAYGSLSRQSQSPFDHRKMSNGSMYTFRPTPPPPPVRQHLELKTADIVLNPVKPPHFQETVMIPRNGSVPANGKLPSNGSVPFNRSVSTESSAGEFSKFCHECGYKFVVPTAKFCIECGVRRIKM